MFGYIKPFRPELRVKELDAYKAVYCGLCGQLGRSFGPVARMILSYDFTFLSMLSWGVNGGAVPAQVCRCPFNLAKRQLMCTGGEPLELGADLAVIMMYYKLLDNIRDEGFFSRAGWTLCRPVAARAHRKAAARRPAQEALIAAYIREQAALEAEQCDSLDRACEPTAVMLAGVLEGLSEDASQRRVLRRMGYLLGRFIYLCDAFDDMEKDARRGGYNPLVLGYRLGVDKDGWQPAREAAVAALYLTCGEAERTLALLELRDFGPIIGNIVGLGMRETVNEILAKKETVR